MSEPKISDLKKYLTILSKTKAKYVTVERLSRLVGIYPDVIMDNLCFFEPTIRLDPSFNTLELIKPIKDYIVNKEEEKSQALINRPKPIKHKEIEKYESIGDFVYKKFTIAGGLLDKNAKLDDMDLRILKKLVHEEQEKRKKK